MNELTSNLNEAMTQSRNYWVVAPYASGDEGKPEWVAFAKTGYVCMGWNRESGKASGFHDEMKGGDVVVIAAGPNANKKVFGVGTVEQESECKQGTLEGMPREAFYRKLVSFITEEKVLKQLNWDSGSTYGDAKQIPAIYKLRPEKPTDKRNMDLLDSIFQTVTI
jgi:hypothetical protein